MELALQYNDSYMENVYSYANSINTTEGGTHLIGFRSALTRVVNNYAVNNNLLKSGKISLKGEDVREGLACVISVKIRQPQFEGQTKTKLGNSEMRGIVESLVNDKLAEFLEENPKIALAWWGKKGGFQIKADITIHRNDEMFRQNVEWVQGIRETLKPKSAIVGKVTDVYIVKGGPDAGKKII